MGEIAGELAERGKLLACCSMRVTSRTRSSSVLTQRCAMEGMAASISGKRASSMSSTQPLPMA